jgi:hypothetical protein
MTIQLLLLSFASSLAQATCEIQYSSIMRLLTNKQTSETGVDFYYILCDDDDGDCIFWLIPMVLIIVSSCGICVFCMRSQLSKNRSQKGIRVIFKLCSEREALKVN